MSVLLSGIGAIRKEQLISSCSNGEPNWSFIPTKGKSSKTQTEFVSEIRELARRAATTTNKTESRIYFQTGSWFTGRISIRCCT